MADGFQHTGSPFAGARQNQTHIKVPQTRWSAAGDPGASVFSRQLFRPLTAGAGPGAGEVQRQTLNVPPKRSAAGDPGGSVFSRQLFRPATGAGSAGSCASEGTDACASGQ